MKKNTVALAVAAAMTASLLVGCGGTAADSTSTAESTATSTDAASAATTTADGDEKPTILLTAIMSTSGTLQLFDESVNLTAGGPGKATMTLTHYIYNISFVETPKFNYAAALSVFILVVVAVLSAIQMKVGDKRE